MSRLARAWEWFLAACSWVVVPLIVVGFAVLVVIETRKQRREAR